MLARRPMAMFFFRYPLGAVKEDIKWQVDKEFEYLPVNRRDSPATSEISRAAEN